MGLLDDAIRDHLDLKRRRGADPSEIAREEVEALGPVRRDEVADLEPSGSYADHEPAALDEPGAAYDDRDLGYDEPAPSYDEPVARGTIRLDDEDAPPPYEPDDEHDRPVPAEPPRTHDAPYAESEAESATPPHGDPLAHQPTREFSATELGDALGSDEPEGGSVALPPADADRDDEADRDPDVVAADEPGAEDELEETPDFLQETPEHDRLWFEQKPPKDFDF